MSASAGPAAKTLPALGASLVRVYNIGENAAASA